MTVRVLRIIEVEYLDQASFEHDRSHWQLPANGERRFGVRGPVFRTATLMSESIVGGASPLPAATKVDFPTAGSDPSS